MFTAKGPQGARHAIEEPEAVLLDRRRPGRLPSVSPELVPLLRGETRVPEQMDADRVRAEQARDIRLVWLALLAFTVLFVSVRYLFWSWLF